MVVHARGQRRGTVFLEGVGGQRDDGNRLVAEGRGRRRRADVPLLGFEPGLQFALPLPDLPGRLKASMVSIWMSIRMTS